MDELLSAAVRLGELWSTSPVVGTFVAERTAALTHNENEPHKPYQNTLQMFLTSGSFNTQPLLTGWWLTGMPQARILGQSPEAKDFLLSASRVAGAYLLLIEWLRSWLPGYPFSFRLPHVDLLASRVVRRGFPNQLLPWPLELRRASLHSVPEIDDQLAPALELQRSSLARPLLELRSQLWASSAWREFVAAQAALDEAAKVRLNTLVDQFRADCRAFQESASERLMLDDAARRAAITRCEEEALLDRPIGRYYKAFQAIDRLIESIGALVTQFAIGEGLPTVQAAQVAWRGGDEPEVRFVIVGGESGVWLRVNQVVHVASPVPALQCIARVEGSTINFDRHLGESGRHLGVIVAMGGDAALETVSAAKTASVLDRIRRQRS